MNNPFTKHPNSVGETYLKHMKIAVNTAIKIQLVTFILLTHAVFPFLFEHTAGDKLYKITKGLHQRRSNE